MTSQRLAVYDSDAVSLIAAALPINDGRAVEEFVTVDKDSDTFEEEESADGSVCRYATHGSLYTITVKLKGWSAENPKLMALHALDANAPNGAGIGIFLLKDGNGSTLCNSDKCWIKKPPQSGFGKNRPDVDWVFKVVANVGQMLIGGN